MSAGEIFLNDIYTALRSSPYWQDTLLVMCVRRGGSGGSLHLSWCGVTTMEEQQRW